MIYYTTGTGNSKYVASEIAKKLSDNILPINETINKINSENEKLIFVLPIHSWGPAILMMRFINQIGKCEQKQKAWVVFVCGDNCGNADKIISKALKKKNIELLGAFSVQMPNNYILMKGFGTDDNQLVQQKLNNCDNRIDQIIDAILRQSNDTTLYVRGNKAWLKSKIVYPLFVHLAVKRVLFRATDKCVGCGLCAQICPTHNIALKDSRPVWNNNCVQCVACIHRCPNRAIEYGDISTNMGRYVHPILKQQ